MMLHRHFETQRARDLMTTSETQKEVRPAEKVQTGEEAPKRRGRPKKSE